MIEEFRKTRLKNHTPVHSDSQNIASPSHLDPPKVQTSTSIGSPTTKIEPQLRNQQSVKKVRAFGLSLIRPKAGFHQLYEFN